MTIFTAIALADLRNRIAAAADIMNRVAGNLAGCLPKPPPNEPLAEIAIDIPDTQRVQILTDIDRAISTAQAVRAVLKRRA
jgi:hypothetical protein